MPNSVTEKFHKRIALFEHFTGRNKPQGDQFNAN
jgi:hypothetical protein